MDLSHVIFAGTPVVRRREHPQVAAVRSTATMQTGISEPTVSGLASDVLAAAKVPAAFYRPTPLRRRTAACLRALGAASEAEAAALLRNPDLIQTAVNALLIGVSGFYRDAEVFDAIRRDVLPALRSASRPLRVLSVGCSTGAELYSIAFMLAEAGLLERAALIGIDCRRDAVAAAERGVFATVELQSLDDVTRRCYFERIGDQWRVTDAVRRHITWRQMNALDALPPGRYDLVLCRNLSIYLQPVAAQALFAIIVDHLATGGYLVVGKAERPGPRPALRTVRRCIYQIADGPALPTAP